MIEIKETIILKDEVTRLKKISNDVDKKAEILLNTYQSRKINKILSNEELKIICKNIYSNKEYKDMSYEKLSGIIDILTDFLNNLNKTKKEVDIRRFFDEKKVLNLKKFKAKFKLLGRDKYFPNFNFNRLKELLENPITELLPQDGSSKDMMVYDEVIVKKYLYGIIQMVLDEMDLVVLFIGKEGMGKSKECSQHMSLLYWILRQLNLVDYDYNIKEMWFNTVKGFNDAEDKYFDVRFRIIGLDEGNELNSQDWQDDVVKTFFQRLRRERERQRIKLIAIPQLVELLKGVAITRSNFIFESKSKDDIETCSLDKGYVNFYILPRNKIYSYYNKRVMSKVEVEKTLKNHLKNKDTGYGEMPESILIKKYKSNFVWGFDRDEYKQHLKETNRTYSVGKGMRLTDNQLFALYKRFPSMKDLGFDKEEKKLYSQEYANLQKLRGAIIKTFEEDPDKKIKFENIREEQYERNLEKLEEEKNK